MLFYILMFMLHRLCVSHYIHSTIYSIMMFTLTPLRRKKREKLKLLLFRSFDLPALGITFLQYQISLHAQANKEGRGWKTGLNPINC